MFPLEPSSSLRSSASTELIRGVRHFVPSKDTYDECSIRKRYPRRVKFFACENCGKAEFGRNNKKFCDAICRNEFNNGKRNRKELPHPALTDIARNDAILKEIFDRFGSEPIPEHIIDSFGSSLDAPFRKTTTPEEDDHIYLDYGILWDSSSRQIQVYRARELEGAEDRRDHRENNLLAWRVKFVGVVRLGSECL